jgi:hypothetical protein
MLPTQLKADLEAELNSALVAVKRSLIRRIRAVLGATAPQSELEELDALLQDAPELASVAGLHVLIPRRVLESLLEGKPVRGSRPCPRCQTDGPCLCRNAR